MNTFTYEDLITYFKIGEMYYKQSFLTQQYIYRISNERIYLYIVYNSGSSALYVSTGLIKIKWQRVMTDKIVGEVLNKYFSDVLMENIL